jgi:hypothetical protein
MVSLPVPVTVNLVVVEVACTASGCKVSVATQIGAET